MAIRAVFFDWVNTLVHLEPDRHVLSSQVCREFGIDLSERDALRGIYAAEAEMSGKRPQQWSPDGDPEIYLQYNERVLAEAGIAPPDRQTALRLLKRFAERYREVTFSVFDDARIALCQLKERGIITGLISNMPQQMQPVLGKLGLEELLDFTVSPLDVNGEGKPAAPIFLAALKRANVKADEALHVGDEHFSDGVGARGVGITPVIIDRYNLFASLTDYHRITSLQQLPSLLDTLE